MDNEQITKLLSELEHYELLETGEPGLAYTDVYELIKELLNL